MEPITKGAEKKDGRVRGKPTESAAKPGFFGKERNRKVGWFWLFQEEIIDERSRALRPGGNRLRESQAANRDGEEEEDQDDEDPVKKPAFRPLFHGGLTSFFSYPPVPSKKN